MFIKTTPSPAKGLLIAAGLLLSAGWLSPSSAAAAIPAPGAVSTPAHPLTAPDLEAWLDGLVPTALNTAQTPGAVVVVVKDGQVLLEKGYGYADYEKRTPVDPRSTLFRPGSTSKLFTWTAVMQLVEEGKINLDADVNAYLDFKTPARNGLPVTMRQLMTHRGGFSETAKDLVSFGAPPPPLGEVLKRYVPPRIFDPQDGPGYSNYGAALAGYIVQRVSGQSFDDYIAQHIFLPLDMGHSTFQQPLPLAMQPHMSAGYDTWDKPGAGFEIVDVSPAGGLSATGDDMAHFMIAHLQLGRYGNGQILQAQTAQTMQTSIIKSFPDLDGNALGFYQQNINGHRVIAHAGDLNYFHSDLSLFLDDHVGLFVSVNARGKDGLGEFLRNSLFDGFADRYFPGAPPSLGRLDPAVAKAHAAMIAGAYISTRRSDSTFVSLVKLVSPTVVTANADGTISAAPAGQQEKFYEIKPFLWQELGGHDRIEATVANGKVVRWSSDSAAPIFIYLRPSGLAATGLETPLALAAMVLLILTALLWPGVALVRWRCGKAFPLTGPRATAYRLVRLCAALGLVAVGLWCAVLDIISATNGADVDILLHAAQLTALLAFVGGLGAAGWNLAMVFKEAASWFAKVYALLLAAAFGMMVWIALAYHLIGVSSQY